MQSTLEKDSLDYLYKAILSLKTREECEAFLGDLCTIQELKSMSQRMLVAKMLHSKTVYSDIVSETGASTATISRVNRCLHYGSSGYKNVLKALEG